jgi:hypothetical protein
MQFSRISVGRISRRVSAMAMTDPPEEIYADPFPGVIRAKQQLGQGLDGVIARVRRRLAGAAPEVVRRWSELPDLDPTAGPHVPLLLEARELYTHGHFYSCVAMCGITAERILKDLLGERFAIRRDGEVRDIPDDAAPELDRFEVSAIARFLTKAGLLEPAVRKAALELAELRNVYAHGSGLKPESDSLKALTLLHVVVQETVVLFKGHESFGSAPHRDILEDATGRFGLEPTNPVPGDYGEYCRSLRCPQGHPYHFKREGSVGWSGPDEHIIDAVVLHCFAGESRLSLYFDVYHAGISGKIPEGLQWGAAEGKRHPMGPGPFRDEE